MAYTNEERKVLNYTIIGKLETLILTHPPSSRKLQLETKLSNLSDIFYGEDVSSPPDIIPYDSAFVVYVRSTSNRIVSCFIAIVTNILDYRVSGDMLHLTFEYTRAPTESLAPDMVKIPVVIDTVFTKDDFICVMISGSPEAMTRYCRKLAVFSHDGVIYHYITEYAVCLHGCIEPSNPHNDVQELYSPLPIATIIIASTRRVYDAHECDNFGTLAQHIARHRYGVKAI